MVHSWNLAPERRDWRGLTGVQEWERKPPLVLVSVTAAGSRRGAAGGRGKGEGSLVGPSTPVSRGVGQRCWVGAGLSPMGMGSLPMDGKPERRNKWPLPVVVCLLLDDR